MAIQKSKPSLHTLLVGIDKYELPVTPLKGCVNDVIKVAKYLETENEHFVVDNKFLIDNEATKENIVKQIRQHLGKAAEGDTALLYFSGHGTQEEADPVFWTMEEDRKHEALVCFDSYRVLEGMARINLLADKELRFLINELSAKNVHILTIFDCCHSGGNTRNGYIVREVDQIRERRFINRDRLSQSFPVRNWRDFIFADSIPYETAKKHNMLQLLPEGRHIQIAACQNDQSAFEVNGEGVFTKNLLQVLYRCNGEVTYYDLQSRIQQYIKNQFDQQPKVYIAGEDESLLFLGFLNKRTASKPMYGNIIYNETLGWTIDLGAMHGISRQSPFVKVQSLDGKQTYEANINEVFATYATLQFERGLDIERTNMLRGYQLHYYSHQIGIYFKFEEDIKNQLWSIISDSNPNIHLMDELYKADYCIRSVKNQIFIARPETLDVPVIKPIVYPMENAFFIFKNFLKHISQFEFVKNLHNSNAFLFNRFPLEIKIFKKTREQENLIPIKHDEIKLKFEGTIHNNGGDSIRIAIKNISDRKLYCCLMYLSFNFEVNVKILQEVVVGLDPNREVWALDGAPIGLTLEEEISIYNYPESVFYLKLIVSTSDFKHQASLFALPPLPGPVAKTTRGLNLDINSYNPGNIEDWTTKLITVRIQNPAFLEGQRS